MERLPSTDCDEDGEEERFRVAYTQYEQMLRFIGRMYPERETLLVGSLHSRIASYIPISSRSDDYSTWTTLVFSKDLLPPLDSLSQHIESTYTFKRVTVEDLDEAIQTSTVLRVKTALAAASNTGAYLASSEERRAQAWCFMSREGSISTVYVRPELRGMGLGKETVRKELEKEFVHRKL